MKPYYEAHGITLYMGDCLEVMAELEAGAFDATITDPPYGTTACAWDSVIPFATMWAHLKRLTRPKGAIVLFGSQPFTSALIASNFEMYKYSWVWTKNKGVGFMNASKMPIRITEDIAIFNSTEYNPQGLRRVDKLMRNSASAGGIQVRGDIASSLGKGSLRTPGKQYIQEFEGFPTNNLYFPLDPVLLHSTQKPLALMEYLIKTYTNEGDTILDFTCGSGTTLRAAKNLKRRCVGIERERHYCDVTVKRLEPTFEQAIIDNGASLADLPMFAESE